MLFDGLEVVPVPHPLLGLGGPRHAGEPHHGPPRHAVVGDARGDAAARHGAAPAVSAGHQAALGRGHRHVQAVAVHVEGPHHPHRHRHVAHHVLAAGCRASCRSSS